ncbi:MAG: class I SAM-dependent methyltransferase [Henriciella sp.]
MASSAGDPSNGYNAIVRDYVRARSSSGREVVLDWAAALPKGARVLDLGAGYGEPITSALIEAGCEVSAIEAAPAMVAEFKLRFPNIRIACEPVEESDFFGERFDGMVAIGLIFLLPEATQKVLINTFARALKPGGSFLCSAPTETGEWDDILTGQRSRSLGESAYRTAFRAAGFTQIDSRRDENGTHYYLANNA